VPGPLKGYNALHCENRRQLHQLIRELAKELQITAYSPEHYEDQLQRVIEASQAANRVEHQQGAIRSDRQGDGALSNQAKEILRQLIRSEQERVLAWRHGSTIYYSLVKDPQLEFSEPEFADEDFKSLVNAEYLMEEIQPNGSCVYWLTRRGALFARAL
jgi:hypothetical protein